VAKDVVENVVEPCTPGELFGGDVNIRTLDGRDKIAGKLGHEPEDECALLCHTAIRLEKERRGWVRRTSLVSVAVNGLITERVKLLLRLTHERVKPRFHIRQLVAYMVHKHLKKNLVRKPRNSPARNACKRKITNLVERLGEVLRAVLERDVPILRMTREKLRLTFEGVGHALVGVDVPLRTVHNADKAQFERIHASREHVKRVRPSIHQVQLGEDADCPPALWVDGPRELEGVGVGEVYVCGGDRENDAIVRVRVHMRVCIRVCMRVGWVRLSGCAGYG
jgi:hypothetical protein